MQTILIFFNVNNTTFYVTNEKFSYVVSFCILTEFQFQFKSSSTKMSKTLI